MPCDAVSDGQLDDAPPGAARRGAPRRHGGQEFGDPGGVGGAGGQEEDRVGGAPDGLLDGEVVLSAPARGPQLRLDPAGVGHREPHVPQVAGRQTDSFRGGQGAGGRLRVGPHEAAGAQEDSAEVPGDDDGGRGQVRGPQRLEHRPTGRARGLAVVVGALDRQRARAGDRVGRAVVTGVRVITAHHGDEGPRLLLAVRARSAGQEVGSLDLQVDLGLIALGQGERRVGRGGAVGPGGGSEHGAIVAWRD